MCNRYNVVGPSDTGMAFRVGKQGLCWVSPRLSDVAPTVFPGRMGAVIRWREGELGLDAMSWRLIPGWAKAEPGLTQADALKALAKKFERNNNAREESLHRLPSWRGLFRWRRCIAPAESFVEWPRLDGKPILHTVSRADGAPIYFAGLWDRWQGPEGNHDSYTIITAEPHESVRWLHHRMPVVLEPGQAETWMDPEAPVEVLQRMLVSPTAGTIEAHLG